MRAPWTSPEGFEQLVREHQNAVFRTLYRMTGPGAHLDDLAQEVFLRLYRALPEFRGEAMLSTYLYRITYNVAQDEWKRRRRERETFSPESDREGEDASWLENLPPAAPEASAHHRTPEQELNTRELQGIVETCMALLPDTERAVLVLYHQESLSYEGIASALGLPVNTVRTHLHRGRKRLAENVQQRLVPAQRPTMYAAQRRAG